jgi:CMP-2-keto-3-deoxyoctulosonic acid synthetase
VFIDDIERCKPPRSVEVLDAVNQLMSHKGVVVVFLGDMSAVAAAAQLKYKDLAEIFVPSAGIALTGADRGKEAFGRLYLQKIVQFQFDLPIPPTSKIRQFMKQMADTPEAKGGRDGRG